MENLNKLDVFNEKQLSKTQLRATRGGTSIIGVKITDPNIDDNVSTLLKITDPTIGDLICTLKITDPVIDG